MDCKDFTHHCYQYWVFLRKAQLKVSIAVVCAEHEQQKLTITMQMAEFVLSGEQFSLLSLYDQAQLTLRTNLEIHNARVAKSDADAIKIEADEALIVATKNYDEMCARLEALGGFHY